MVNGDLAGDAWIHYCHDESTGRPCCASTDECIEKTLVSVVNVVLGKTDPCPAESRWTHLLEMLKRTLLRRVIYSVGIDCFDEECDEDFDRTVQVDDEASGEYFQKLKKSRVAKTSTYYREKDTFWQITIYVCLVQIYDKGLLYGMFGDPNCEASKQCENTQAYQTVGEKHIALGPNISRDDAIASQLERGCRQGSLVHTGHDRMRS